MDQNKLIECIEFFNNLKIIEEDVTTDIERQQGYFVVVVTYEYEGKSYQTKRLFYKDISLQKDVNNANGIQNYFGKPVYWLDIVTHKWPHGKGAEIERTIIKDMFIGNNPDFEILLKKIANNQSTGFLQEITWDGRSQQYGFNFENNNHWHDLIKLVQFVIKHKGKYPEKEYFKRLVFRWRPRNKGRDNLHPFFGERALITELLKNIKSIQIRLLKMEFSKILLNKKQIILQGPPGTGKTYTAKDIAYKLIFNQEISQAQDVRKEQLKELESSEQFKLVQFHPSYSYEDFVRGIIAKSDGTAIEYKTINKVFGNFAEQANESNLIGGVDDFERAWYELINDINNKSITKIGSSSILVDINSQGNIRFNSPVATFSQTYALYKFGKTNLKYETYQKIVLDFLKDKSNKYLLQDYVQPQTMNSEKPYILIIDEINRANLPSVLGELIYALEYRGEKVESMYEIDGDSSLIIPPNLYIIGTMNTADRSIGHIDYAIRRRFAFVDILPDASVIIYANAKALFEEISTLFNSKDTLASDFKAEQVQLGHSYFIVNDEAEFQLKAKYEIVPILEEYLKDGILLEKAEEKIKELKERFGN
jgi:5-methylcytosine-specific restriction endonuclease McrBC GTP-binding regulatory subunit McrB